MGCGRTNPISSQQQIGSGCPSLLSCCYQPDDHVGLVGCQMCGLPTGDGICECGIHVCGCNCGLTNSKQRENGCRPDPVAQTRDLDLEHEQYDADRDTGANRPDPDSESSTSSSIG